MRLTVLAIVLCACGSAPPVAEPAPAAPAGIVADGLAIYPGALEDAPPQVREVYRRLTALLETRSPAAPRDTSVAALHAWTRSTLARFLARHRERVGAMERLASELAEIGPRERTFGALSVALAFEDFARRVDAIPVPDELREDAELLAIYRDALADAATPLLARAAQAYGYCRSRSEELDPSMREWAERCASRAAALEARLASQAARAQPERARTIAWPQECAGESSAPPAPEAPPPDARRPEAIAIVTSDPQFEGSDRRRLLEAVRERVRALLPAAAVIETREVEAAEALVGERRVEARGPQCGQAPPLAWVLARRRPNLVIAEVSTSCVLDDPSPEDACGLQVRFRRAGSASAEGLPETLEAVVAGGEPAAAAYVDAAPRLSPGVRPIGGILGVLRGGGAPIEVRVRGDEDEDPWLRPQEVLRTQTDALAACLPEGVVSLAARVRVSRTGEPAEVAVEPLSGGSAELAACVQRAIEASRWPCTPSAREQRVEVTLCLGRR